VVRRWKKRAKNALLFPFLLFRLLSFFIKTHKEKKKSEKKRKNENAFFFFEKKEKSNYRPIESKLKDEN